MIIYALYTLGVFAIGFGCGVAVKAFLDRDEILELEKTNAKLHREIKTKSTEVIHIVDDTVAKDVKFGGF